MECYHYLTEELSGFLQLVAFQKIIGERERERERESNITSVTKSSGYYVILKAMTSSIFYFPSNTSKAKLVRINLFSTSHR